MSASALSPALPAALGGAASPAGAPPVDALGSIARHRAHWLALSDAGAQQAQQALPALRARLRRHGAAGALRAEALGCVAAFAQRTLGRAPFETQCIAANALLDGQLAEMATGEGKTLAVALAAAVAALAGTRVHVLTANDYLAARDAGTQRALFEALGLRVGVVTGPVVAAARREAYRCDITYATAREVGFDLLRDQLDPRLPRHELQRRAAQLAGETAPEPLVPPRQMAILDEADSLLIDEATTPLVIAEAADDAAHRAACFQALALARTLLSGTHFRVDTARRRIDWQPAGEQQLALAAEGFAGAWHNRRHRLDMVGAALEALHLLAPDRDYLVRDGAIELIDAVTGRAASGRVWSRGLHTMVELKEACRPSATMTTRGQLGFQRFFRGYPQLCGISGSLVEARAELRRLYRRAVTTVPLRTPCRRVCHPERLYLDAAARRAAVVARVGALRAEGRPVLVGTDSVAASEALAAALAVAGVPHQVLNARHDADEAAIVAAAGAAGVVTVATRMAGRGTDIELGPGVAAQGGLHVLNCQDNPSPRLDRQLAGRAARRGDPGSAETWRVMPGDAAAPGLLQGLVRRAPQHADGSVGLPAAWLAFAAARAQQRDEQRAARRRQLLIQQDERWASP